MSKRPDDMKTTTVAGASSAERIGITTDVFRITSDIVGITRRYDWCRGRDLNSHSVSGTGF